MPAQITIQSNEAIPEGASGRVTGTLKDEDGVAIDTSAVTATTATLLDHRGTVVNGRGTGEVPQDVFSSNGGSWAAGGVFTLLLTPLDTVAVETGPEFQARRLGLIVTHSSGKKAPQEIVFYVRKLASV